MDTIVQDLRYGLRSLWKSPGFAIVATVTLALAIGVNTSIFSLVSVIVFADLPMNESERVTLVRSFNPALEIERSSVSPADYLDLEARARSYETLDAVTEERWILTGGDQPTRVEGLRFTVGLTETWKLPPVVGRSFVEGEDRVGAAPVAMLTYGFWQERFGGRPDVLGETIRLDGVEYTIVGVTPPKLEWAMFGTAQVVTPLVIDRGEPSRAARTLMVSGRLAEGVTQEMAAREVLRIGEDLASEHPAENRGWGLRSAPVMESLLNPGAHTILLLLQLTVGMVILIACANIANMLLARATARAREMAVRSALGAGRLRLVRQLLTESLVISLASATLGLGLASLLNRVLVWISAGTEEVFMMAELDGRVLAFTLTVSLAAPLVFGLLPALRASSIGVSETLRDGRSGAAGRSGKRVRGTLVTAQVSLALTLMIVAGLLTRSVANLRARPLGFDPSGLLTVELRLPETGYEEAESRIGFYTEAATSLGRVPGLSDPQIANVIPGAEDGVRRSVVVEGIEVPEGRAAPAASVVTVSPGYLDLIGLPMVGGRGFTGADTPDAPPVAVVSRRIAENFWPNEDPVGRRFRAVDSEAWLEVVGVVADVRATNDVPGGAPNVYVPHDQDPRGRMYLVARASRAPGELAGPIREAIWSVDPDQPVGDIGTMERAQYEASATSYALLTLFVTFAVFALVMAAVGIYGVMAYSVSQRRAEIALRLALGAERRRVGWMVVSEGAVLVAAGVGIGLLASVVLSRLLANVVYEVTATDPLTFVGVPVVLAAVALASNVIPARRAIRLDPARTLRAE